MVKWLHWNALRTAPAITIVLILAFLCALRASARDFQPVISGKSSEGVAQRRRVRGEENVDKAAEI
jgi:hypothetical protein